MQNTLVLEAMEFRRPCGLEYQSKHEFKNTTTTVSCYRGAVFPPRWKDTDTRKSDLKIMKENKKVMGGIENYRSLRNISGPFSPPSVASIEVLWGRYLLLLRVRDCLAVRSDRVTGCSRLEGARGFTLRFLASVCNYTMFPGCRTTESSKDPNLTNDDP